MTKLKEIEVCVSNKGDCIKKGIKKRRQATFQACVFFS